jgi:ankyrin repeat protein
VSDALPSRPDLDWLKNRAQERLAELRGSDPSAKLADAQKDVARRYGFPSWRALKAHVDAARAPQSPQVDEFTDQVVQAFFHGVGTGQLDAVRAALDRVPALAHAVGPHPFWGGRPQALHVAIESDRREVFDLLLARGASVDGSNAGYMGWSPLLLALNRKRAEMIRELLARGAHVGLAEALARGDDARVDALLDQGGLPRRRRTTGPAPLRAHDARARPPVRARRGHRPQGLLGRFPDRGAEPHRASGRAAGGPPGARGAQAGAAELARMAIARRTDVRGRPAQVRAPRRSRLRSTSVIASLRSGSSSSVATSTARPRTGVRDAAAFGRVERDLGMVMLLVEAGADVHARDRQYDSTPRAGRRPRARSRTTRRATRSPVPARSRLGRNIVERPG